MPEITDRVTLTTVTIDWGNDIRDRTVQRYDDDATRTSEHGTPTDGDLAFMQDTGKMFVFYNSGWRDVGITDHGLLTGKGDDDHTQYYNAARHTLAVHTALGLSADGHTHTGTTISSLDAGDTTTGVFSTSRIPSLDASKIGTGVFHEARLPNASTSAQGVVQLVNAVGSTSTTTAPTMALATAIWDQTVHLTGNETIEGTKTFNQQPQMILGLDIPGTGTLDMHWPGVRRINDSAWGSLRLEGDVGYRLYFHTSTKYSKSNETDISVEDSYKALWTLRPLTYDNEEGKRNIGFFAENVQKAEPLTAPKPRKTARGPDEVPSYSEDGILAHLVNVARDIVSRVDALEDRA